jgi:putative protease
MAKTVHVHPKKIPELLAPAGSPEAFLAAVNAGADAVYLSGKQFGARKFAPNFSNNEIEEAVMYAHARGVRVYVTVNTLVHDKELPGAMEYLVNLYSIGVDAVLVQDVGVAALAHKIVPGLTLHASTQLTIHNAEGVRWAQSLGFSRVVLARELPLSEVDSIAQETADTGVGLEIFAHGALCYSYSGQCLLSSVIGGRSGNRGMCAQPCRKKYSVVTAGIDRYGRPTNLQDVPVSGPYLLSPKDLCTYQDIPRLIDAPVESLKIEGRMKSAEYVSIVVSTYRRALDAAAAGVFVPDKTATRDLFLAFNRGFTRGYLFGDSKGKLMSRDRPDNRGLFIGTVSRYDRKTGIVTVHPDKPIDIHTGDGLLFSHPENPEAAWGFSLNTKPCVKADGIELAVPRNVEKGSLTFLTASVGLASRSRQIINRPDPGLRHLVPVDMVARVTPEGLLTLSGTLNPPGREPVSVEMTEGLQLEPARTSPLTKELLGAQLDKAGGTPFSISSLMLDYDGTLFAPVRGINRLRRDFFTLAEKILVASYRPLPESVSTAGENLNKYCAHYQHQTAEQSGRTIKIILFTDSLESVEAGARAKAGTICFEPPGLNVGENKHGAANTSAEEAIRTALEVCKKHNAHLILKLPRITRKTEITAIRSMLPRLYTAGLRACMVENPGAALAVIDTAPGIALSGSGGLNVFNAETVRTLKRMPFETLLLSPELSADDVGMLVRSARSPGTELAVFAQGNLETMVTEDCLLSVSDICKKGSCDSSLFYGIRDETGHLLPVRMDAACRGHVFNAAETCLVDAVPALVKMGIDGLVIDARGRTPAYAEEITKIYRDAIALAAQGTGSTDSQYTLLRERVKAIALGGISSGHYTRGLKEEYPHISGSERLNVAGGKHLINEE